MSPELWKEIESLFELACDMPLAERSLFLSERCGHDGKLRAEVENLLNNSDLAESFMEAPVWTDSFLDSSVKKVISTSLDEPAEDKADFTGRVVDPYKLIAEIGRGGMGTVYRAERIDGEFYQEVAIKLLKRGLDSDFVVKRFRHERQILASFEHPFISRLLDGGTTSEGLPYFVMEYIRGGVTIYDWCDQHKLDISARLKLFLKVCSALAYAHERKIVHRDIKPSNILVNRSGAPKLLDFGIAKILDPDLIHESFNPTASLVRMMTPDYASPEQVRGFEITPSSDIYSLGVLLYELLCGHRPYKVERHDLQELSTAICETEPVPLDKVLFESRTLLKRYPSESAVAETRSTSPVKLSVFLSILDPIVKKALAKDPTSRYETVDELSEEVSRILNSGTLQTTLSAEGIRAEHVSNEAARPSLAVLPFRMIMFTHGRDTEEQFIGVGLADSLISRLGRVHKFLVVPTSSIIGFGNGTTDPIRAGRQLKVDYILDGSIKMARDRLRLSVQLLDVKGNAAVWATSIDEKIGEFAALEEALSNQLIEVLVPRISSAELASYSHRGTDSPEAFANYVRGRYHFSRMTEDNLAKAFVLFHRAIAADPNYAHAYCGIANYYNWLGVMSILPPIECFKPALEAASKAVELDPELSEAQASLGFSLHVGSFDWENAEAHFQKAIDLNANNANAYLWYSTFLFMSGRFEKGFEYAYKAINLDPLSPYSHYNIGSGLYYARRFSEAEKQHQKVIDEFPDYGLGHYGLSKLYRYLGKINLAVEENERAMELLDGSILVQISLAECLAADGQREAALGKLDELEELGTKRFVSPYMLALAYSFLHEKEKVLGLLEKSLEYGEAWLCCAPVEARFEPVFREKRFSVILHAVNHPLRERPAFLPYRTKEDIRNLSDLTTILMGTEND
jgi:serine/threonine protein kinase/tetratricopeptide (TPR) repeat protein